MVLFEPFWFVLLFLLAAMIISVKSRKLTIAASIVGGAIGFLIYAGTGLVGLMLMGFFFLLGSAATSWRMNYKQQGGLAEENSAGRKVSQVLANSGVAALLSMLLLLYPKYEDLFVLMMAATFASATADTLSSELGNAYGTRFYNILTFKKDIRGLNGVISFEGTFIGILGAAAIATAYSIALGFTMNFFWIILAGTIGNLTDSLLGATLERKGYLNNDEVNFLNTVAAAAFMLLLKF
jgi:uncharacterized protein (TIGR00297 family)